MAFTDYETEQLRKALMKETRHCAVTLGMKKTSVDQLTKAVGIAKGSFYKFFESKEMLFFAVLENIHSELYRVADNALSEADSLPPPERAAKAVLAVCQRLSDTGDMVFCTGQAYPARRICLKRGCTAPASAPQRWISPAATGITGWNWQWNGWETLLTGRLDESDIFERTYKKFTIKLLTCIRL